MNDIELWKLVWNGDYSALSMLYCRYYELMLNFGLRYMPDVELVKDCIQDVFVKICSSRRLSDLTYVRSYLLASMRNVLIDRLRAALGADFDESIILAFLTGSVEMLTVSL